MWQNFEPPLVVQGFAGAAVHTPGAAAFLIGFDCPLRSTELYHLKAGRKDPFFDKAVSCLGQSKPGKRAGAGQMVVVESQLAINGCELPALASTNLKGCFGVNRFDIEGLFTVYSLRRGRAAWNGKGASEQASRTLVQHIYSSNLPSRRCITVTDVSRSAFKSGGEFQT